MTRQSCGRPPISLSCFVFLFLFCTPLFRGLGWASEPFEFMEFRPEAKLGVGWSALTNDIATRRETCIEMSGAEPSSKTNDNPQYFGQFRLVHSTTDIEDGFGLSTSASFQGLVYKGAGSVKYAQSRTYNAENINAAGFITVETRSESLYGSAATVSARDPSYLPSWTPVALRGVLAQVGGLRLKPEFSKMLNENPKAFFEHCGDGFVTDIYRGGRLSVLLNISAASVGENKKLQAEISGSGGGVDIGVDSMISKVSAHSNTSLNGSYFAVGGSGRELSLASLDALKAMLKTFPEDVHTTDAGIRMRVMSYNAVLDGEDRYRFGIVESARAAARTYLDFNSIWKTMREMTDGALKPKLAWNRSVDPACLSRKQDEILSINRDLLNRLEDCGAAMASTMESPQQCQAAQFAAVLKAAPAAGTCPATPTLIGDTVTDYDYRIFFPAFVETNVLDGCHQPGDAAVRELVREDWLKPVIDARCRSRPEDKPECQSTVANRLTASIHVNGRPPPPLPTGGYLRSCKNCVVKWDSAGKQTMRCSCSRGGKFGNTAWITPQCPQKAPLQNCSRRLKYGKKPC